jgi:hypothetical protein
MMLDLHKSQSWHLYRKPLVEGLHKVVQCSLNNLNLHARTRLVCLNLVHELQKFIEVLMNKASCDEFIIRKYAIYLSLERPRNLGDIHQKIRR